MKAEIKRDGFIHIIAETPQEAFAIKYLCGKPEIVATNDIKPPPIVFNCEVLNQNSSTVGAK